jgi:GNAT superfamily N-acetyltransferase
MFRKIIRKLLPVGVEYKSIIFFRSDLIHEPHNRLTSRKVFESHIISKREDQWLKTMCSDFPVKLFMERIEGDRQHCYIAIDNGHLAAFAWVTSSPCLVSEINFYLDVGARNLYVYDFFVKSQYRRQGYYRALLTKILEDFRIQNSEDFSRTVYIGAEPVNVASIRTIEGVGFEPFANVKYLHFGQKSRWFGVAEIMKGIQLS